MKESHLHINVTANTGSSLLTGSPYASDPYYTGFWVRFIDRTNGLISILNLKLRLVLMGSHYGIQEYGVVPQTAAEALREAEDADILAAIIVNCVDNIGREIILHCFDSTGRKI